MKTFSSDGLSIRDYPNIKENTKLMLSRLKPDLKNILHRHFSKFYDSQISSELAQHFIDNMKTNINSFSLDDLERFAEAHLTENQ